MSDLSLFRFSMPVFIRYADLDVLGHVNNARYFTFAESARIQYMKEVVGWSGKWEELNLILARTACDFRLPLHYGHDVRTYARVSRLGNSSFDFEYLITVGEEKAISAEMTSTQVVFDYETNKPTPIPDHWREKIVAFEPGLT